MERFCEKEITAFSHELLWGKTPSKMFVRALNIPLWEKNLQSNRRRMRGLGRPNTNIGNFKMHGLPCKFL